MSATFLAAAKSAGIRLSQQQRESLRASDADPSVVAHELILSGDRILRFVRQPNGEVTHGR